MHILCFDIMFGFDI